MRLKNCLAAHSLLTLIAIKVSVNVHNAMDLCCCVLSVAITGLEALILNPVSL